MATRSKMKGRSNGLHYSQLIHAYFESPEYARLSPRAVKALIDLFCQYRGKNNGDLCATYSVMKKRGWRSNDQIRKAINELLETDWIMITRQGGRRKPTLYAVTFMAIDDCGGKLDVKPTTTAPHTWKRPGESSAPVISLNRRAVQCEPPHGSIRAA